MSLQSLTSTEEDTREGTIPKSSKFDLDRGGYWGGNLRASKFDLCQGVY